jgi:hypothetical protein
MGREVFEVSREKVVVLGSNFGGLTAALAVKLEQNHAMKLAFEKYFLWKMKGGHVMLP